MCTCETYMHLSPAPEKGNRKYIWHLEGVAANIQSLRAPTNLNALTILTWVPIHTLLMGSRALFKLSSGLLLSLLTVCRFGCLQSTTDVPLPVCGSGLMFNLLYHWGPAWPWYPAHPALWLRWWGGMDFGCETLPCCTAELLLAPQVAIDPLECCIWYCQKAGPCFLLSLGAG